MNLDLMKNLCSLETTKLYSVLVKFLHRKGYKKIYRNAHYIMAEGEIPICLVAHMDTVFKFKQDPEDFFYDPEKKMLWAPYGCGFDDRAGIYSTIQLVEMGLRPHIIFTDLEEVGGKGAHELVKKFPICPFGECKMIIQIDRANEKDCVFYNCGNDEFINFIESYGFEFNLGTFTDISIICPQWGIAGVNVSCGYLDEHSSCERLMCDWCDATIDKIYKILLEVDEAPNFEYIARPLVMYNKYSTTGADVGYSDFTCVICGKPITSYKEARFYNMDGFNYCICRDCEETYGGEGEGEFPQDDEPIPWDAI